MKEEKAMFPVVSWSGVRLGFPRPLFASGGGLIFFGRDICKGKTVEKFVNKQLSLAKLLSKLNRKKVRVAVTAHPNDFIKASILSGYEIKCK